MQLITPSLIKRLSGFIICALLPTLPIMTYGAQFIVIECWAAANQYAYFSDPVTGKVKQANSCGEALATVPPHYSFLSSVAASRGGNVGGVKFLFSDTPAPKE